MAQIQPPSSNYISQSIHGKFNAVDYAGRTSRFIPVMNNRNIYAVEDGKITAYAYSGDMGNRLELTSSDGKRRWGMGHLESASVPVGSIVKRGQLLGVMGHTGLTIPKGYFGIHLHLVCLADGKYVYPPTLMNMPFSVYTVPSFKMPPVGSKIQLLPKDKRTTYKAGTTTVAGTINVIDNSFVYTIQGYDPKFPNRVLINSKSAGGNGVALALYLTNGTKINGWKQL